MFSLEKYIQKKMKKLLRRVLKVVVVPRIRTKSGYIKKRNVFSYSRYEHREVAEQVLGRKLSEGEVVHHIDFVRSNNHPSNLCVMSEKDHKHYHNWHRWMEENRPDVELTIDYRKNKLKSKWICHILDQ